MSWHLHCKFNSYCITTSAVHACPACAPSHACMPACEPTLIQEVCSTYGVPRADNGNISKQKHICFATDIFVKTLHGCAFYYTQRMLAPTCPNPPAPHANRTCCNWNRPFLNLSNEIHILCWIVLPQTVLSNNHWALRKHCANLNVVFKDAICWKPNKLYF